MKLRRSERMVVISNYLINHPYELTSLNTFAEKYESAKSSISEDIVIIKRSLRPLSQMKNQKRLFKISVINSLRATVFYLGATSIFLISSATRKS